jgi:hypothetical protein
MTEMIPILLMLLASVGVVIILNIVLGRFFG